MNVQVMIQDFAPTLRGAEYLFQGLQHSGVDGVELMLGLKSRWNIAHYQKLAEQYDIPIVSLHQPLWAAMGLYFDENSFALANRLGVSHVTCHPLPRVALQSPSSQAYLQHLADIQRKAGVSILLENLPEQYDNPLLRRLFPLKKQVGTITDIHREALAHGLGMTLDIDHLQLAKPHEAEWFAEVLPSVQNIHLSSFSGNKRHLPVYTGELQITKLIQALKKSGYKGLLTLEVNCPKAITWRNYDFDAIKKSVDIIKQ